ncbi:MAG: DUF933 domain-containing protein [Chloroflexi bacterium]|nr:DUF933 domain-containing protein [Chloroflexota bacterium]
MQPTVALIGRPDSGIDQVFNAAVGSQVVESRDRMPRRIGALGLPDRRLTRLAEVMGSRSEVQAQLTLWHFPGHGLGLGADVNPAWLGELRTADILGFVIRPEAGADVQATLRSNTDGLATADARGFAGHPATGADVEFALRSSADDLAAELALWDLEVLEGAIARAHERATKGPRVERREAQHALELLSRAREQLSDSAVLDTSALTPDDQRALRGFGLFAAKPRAVLANVDDPDAPAAARATESLSAFAVVAGETEAEIWSLEPDDAQAFRDDLGLPGTAADRVGAAVMQAAGLHVFYTANRAAATAWLLPVGGTALEAAATIHSDFAQRFIGADVAPCDEVISADGLAPLRAAGRLQRVGRDHVLADRDVLQIHFSR